MTALELAKEVAGRLGWEDHIGEALVLAKEVIRLTDLIDTSFCIRGD